MTTTPNTTASGAAGDSLLLCAADLRHSAIHDNLYEMIDCAHAVAERIMALAASAPVAPTLEAEAVRWEFRWLNPANNPYSSPSEMAWKLVEPKGMQPLEATLSDLREYRYAGNPCYEVRPLFAQATPVAPAPRPAPMPYPTDAQVDAVYEQTMGQHLRSQDAPAVRRFGRAMFLCAWNAAAPKADHIEDDLAMAPAPLQQGEYPETLYEGGRESVDDALAVVESFGPGVQGLNDTFARQVLLGQEVRRLRAAYEHACQGRSDFRNLYRASRGAAQAAPAPVAEDAEDAARWRLLPLFMQGYDVDWVELLYNLEVTFKRGVRAQAAQPEGGAK